MAKQRIINTRLWNDSWVSNLDPIEKLLFVYLLTNEHTDISGVYELPLKIMAIETSIDRENLEKVLLPRFENSGKVLYRNGWVAVKNFIKHQNLNPKVQAGIEIGLNKAPNELKDFVQDRLSIGYGSLSHPNPNPNPNPKRDFSEDGKTTLSEPSLPEEELDVSPVDEDGNPITARKRKPSERKNIIAIGLQKHFNDLARKELGTRPILDSKGYFATISALKHLSADQIKDLFSEWFALGKPDEEAISLPRALSNRQIEQYKIRNQLS